MIRRGALALAVVVLASMAMPAHAQEKQRLVTFRGTGGQTATLSVASASTITFPWFGHPRLVGPDGTISGVLVQRGREVVGGAVLLNAPGFDDAIILPIGDMDGMRLAAGSSGM